MAGGGDRSAMAPPTFSEILMLRRKIFRLLLLVEIKVSNFIGKSLNLAPLLYRCHVASDTPDNWDNRKCSEISPS